MSFLQPSYRNQAVANEYDASFYFVEENSFTISLDSNSDRYASIDFEGDQILIPYVIKCNKSFSVSKVNSIEKLHINKWSIDETGLFNRVLYGSLFLKWLRTQSYDFDLAAIKDLVQSTTTPLFVYYKNGEIRVGNDRYWPLYGLPNLRTYDSNVAKLCNQLQRAVDDRNTTDLEEYVSQVNTVYTEEEKYVTLKDIEIEDTFVYGTKYSLGSIGDAVKRYNAKKIKGKDCFYFMANGWSSTETVIRDSAEVKTIEETVKYRTNLISHRIKFNSDGLKYSNVFSGICPTPICSFLEGQSINYVRKT